MPACCSASTARAKVGLKLKGEVKDGKLAVAFDARDYLDRPVKGTAASYTATVVRNADPAKLTLDPAEFAKPEGGPPAAEDFEALPDDERLLTLANGVSAMTFAGFGSRFVASREGTVPVDKDGSAKLDLDLQPRVAEGRLHDHAIWRLHRRHRPREPRASTFKLDPNPTRGVQVEHREGTVRDNREDPGPGHAVRLQGWREVRDYAHRRAARRGSGLAVGRAVHRRRGDVAGQHPHPGTRARRRTKKLADGWKSVPVFDPVKRKIVDRRSRHGRIRSMSS